jgi:hypothetical protein
VHRRDAALSPLGRAQHPAPERQAPDGGRHAELEAATHLDGWAHMRGLDGDLWIGYPPHRIGLALMNLLYGEALEMKCFRFCCQTHTRSNIKY